MEEQKEIAVIAAEIEPESVALRNLEERVAALEAALGEVRSVAASAFGRKTVLTAVAKDAVGALDAALGGLSPEQRIAVKSGMARSGLL